MKVSYVYRNLFLGLMLATTANAGSITQFQALSNSFFSMEIQGIDDQGDAVNATFNTYAPLLFCACQPFGLQAMFGGNGSATVNGISYYATTLVNANESFSISISGSLPPITAPAGTTESVSFPIYWAVYFTFYQNGPNNTVVPLFQMNGGGTGTATSNLTVLQSGDNLVYSGSVFSFTSDAPEPSTGMMLGLGLMAGIMVKRKARVS